MIKGIKPSVWHQFIYIVVLVGSAASSPAVHTNSPQSRAVGLDWTSNPDCSPGTNFNMEIRYREGSGELSEF